LRENPRGRSGFSQNSHNSVSLVLKPDQRELSSLLLAANFSCFSQERDPQSSFTTCIWAMLSDHGSNLRFVALPIHKSSGFPPPVDSLMIKTAACQVPYRSTCKVVHLDQKQR